MRGLLFYAFMASVLVVGLNAEVGFDGKERTEFWPSRFLKDGKIITVQVLLILHKTVMEM